MIENSLHSATVSNTMHEQDETLNIKRLFSHFRRNWYLFLIFPFLAGVVAYFYTRYIVPQYKSTATILIRQDDKKKRSASGNMALDPSMLFSGSVSNVADELEILKSRSLMQDALRILKVNPAYFVNGRLKSTEYYNDSPLLLDTFRILHQSRSNTGTLTLKLLDKSHFEASMSGSKTKVNGEFGTLFYIDSSFFRVKAVGIMAEESYTIKIQDLEAMANSYVDRLSVVNIKAAGNMGYSNAIRIDFEDPTPQKGKDLVTTLINSYNEFGVVDKNRSDRNAIAFIDARIDSLNVGLQSVEKNIESFKRQQGITADGKVDIEYLIHKLGTSDATVVDLEIKKSVLKSLSDAIANQSKTKDYVLMPMNLVDNNPNLTTQMTEFNRLVLERERLIKYAKRENPSVILIEEQIARMRDNLRENIDANLKNVQQEVNLSLDKFKNEKTATDKKLRDTPQKERELLEVSRLKNIKESVYLFLFQKREESALSLATTVPNARILDAASNTEVPVKPNKQSIVVIAALLGLLLPIVTIYAKVLLDDTIENEDDIRAQTRVPFLGYLTQGKLNSPIAVAKGSRSSTAETFRLLRANMQFMLAGAKNKIILVTSSMSGEGKSFVTLNLGLSFAMSGKKTIILGFDLRKPKLTAYLNPIKGRDEAGITNYLAGDADLKSLIMKSSIDENLYYLASGPIPPNPAELILSEKTDKIFEYLKTEFDFIIVDTPPVGLVVDGVILNKYAATTLYVARYNKTKKGQLRIVDNLAKENKLANPSIVLNGVRTGGSYGYGYGYGYGYYEK